MCCIVFLHNVQPISHSVNAHRGYLSESSVCITQNSFMKNKFWAQQYNISSSSSSFFCFFFVLLFGPCILLYSLSQNCVSVRFIKFPPSHPHPLLLCHHRLPPLLCIFIGGQHIIISWLCYGLLLFLLPRLLSVPELAWAREMESLTARTVRFCGDDK